MLVLLAACRHAEGPPRRARAPEGEVWLSTAQVARMHLEIAPVAEQPVQDTVLAAGRIAFDDSLVTHVYSPVSGRVVEIAAALGQHVHRGDPLAVLQSPDVGTASADLDKARADLVAAEHDLSRQRELVAEGAASRHDLEQAEDTARRAQAEVARSEERARLFQASRGGVTQRFVVRAEIDGDIVARAVTPGIEVAGQYGGGTPMELFTIGSLDRVWVLADVFEIDLARVHIGAPVAVRVVSYPHRLFPAHVDYVSDVLDPATRSARIRCVLDNRERLLRPEMYATVAITVDAARALAIPRGALLRLGDQTVVFVDAGESRDGRERFVRTPVIADEAQAGQWLPVEHGLALGDRIVVGNGILLLGML